ncbi:MAG: delta 1-pyrroline-5-carboxylate synthetase [Methanosphaera sp.]|nr:delta 1-pyrroline-5-carboxylate synthetase [Methanosphaera sp.]
MYVIKIGGSLYPDYVDDIIDVLDEIPEKVVLVNGGGMLANQVRELDNKVHYSMDTNHWMAIMCMDIIATLIADRHDNIVLVDKFEDISCVHRDNKIPLMLTYDLLREYDPLIHSWEVTSDSIACWICSMLNAKLLILTNVNGIYNGDICNPNKKLIKNISASELLIFEETSVDKCLPKLLIKYNLDCFVLNGKYPERLLALTSSDSNNNSLYTYIGGK